MAKISIIIAAYNVEKYIREALDSAVNQTLADVEVICVDDGSTDGTAAILEEYRRKYPQLRVIRHDENTGLLRTRYDGLKESTGKYILFLDGDDFLHLHTCEDLYAAAIESRVDILQYGIVLLSDKAKNKSLEGLSDFTKPYLANLPFDVGGLVNKCYIDRDFSWNICGKLFTREVIEKAFSFYQGERLVMAEDVLMFFMCLVFAGSYKGINKPFYYYRIGSGISTTTAMSTQKLRAYAEEYQVLSLLRSWLTALGKFECYTDAYEMVRKLVYTDVALAFLHHIEPMQCEEALEILLQYWPLDELIKALALNTYDEHIVEPDELAWRCRSIKKKKRTDAPIRTIGTYYYRLRNGGIERVISLLAPIWQKAGYRVVILTDEAPTQQDYPLPEGVERVVLPEVRFEAELLRDVLCRRIDAWRDAIETYHIDTIVYHAWLDRYCVADQLAVCSMNIPFVLHTHGPASLGLMLSPNDGSYQTSTQGHTFCLSDHVLTLSEVDQAWWQAIGLPSQCILNPSMYKAENIEPSSLQTMDVLWVGRLSQEKQIDEAFAIAQMVHKVLPQMRLRVVGGAETARQFEETQEYLSSNHLTDYIILEGFHKDVAPFYQKAALVLWTAAFEGAPMAMVEAKAFGLPIVAYELANVDMVRRSEGMIVVPQKDRKAAADAVVELLQNDEKRLALGRESRRSGERILSTDFAALWKAIFEKAQRPLEEPQMSCKRPPLEVAVEMAMKALASGIRSGNLEIASSGDQQLAKQNAEYAVMVQELRSSRSYRLGNALLHLPHKMKALIKDKK